MRLTSSSVRVIAAFVAGLLVASGPQIASAAFDAVNSDKVDGRDAVGASTAPADRAGKLVAANSAGRLPNNIIARAPNADRLDGRDSTDFLPAGTNTVVVGQVGSPAQNGAALLASLAAIPTSGSRAPTPTNQWLLKIEPGVYELAAPDRLVMRDYVAVEGSGPGTVISCACAGTSLNPAEFATVTMAPTAELRSLTVRTTGGGHTAVAIGADSAATISDVVAEAGGGDLISVGIGLRGPGPMVVQRTRVSVSGSSGAFGIESQAEDLLIVESHISTSANISRGIQIDALNGGTNWIRNTIASATGSNNEASALRVQVAATYRVDGSSLTAAGTNASAIKAFSGTTVHVSATRLDGLVTGPGTFACVGAFGPTYVALNAACL